ncbi:MAG: hypothetical protein AB1774_00950 [Bacillota bacterium]
MNEPKRRYMSWLSPGRLPAKLAAATASLLLTVTVAFGYGAVAQEGGTAEQASPGREQFVYKAILHNGGGSYIPALAPPEIDAIYIVANRDSVLSPRVTRVYFWPITQEYKADWLSADEPVRGDLEIYQGSTLIRTLAQRSYALGYPTDASVQETFLYLDDEALNRLSQYQTEINRFYQMMSAYYRDQERYQDELWEFIKRPGEKEPTAPVRPEPPDVLVSSVERGFVVNLPPGLYKIQLRGTDGAVVEGSSKILVAFDGYREGIAYEVIPEEKWTMPEHADGPEQVLYFARRRTVYVRPFMAREYDQFAYSRLCNLASPLAGRGTEGTRTWVRLDPVGDGFYLQVETGGPGTSEIKKKLYRVKQHHGTALGYDIVEATPADAFEGSPSFEGYRIDLSPGRHYTVQLVSSDGRVVPGSRREIRGVNLWAGPVLIVASFTPLLAGAFVLVRRRSLYRTIRHEVRRGS